MFIKLLKYFSYLCIVLFFIFVYQFVSVFNNADTIFNININSWAGSDPHKLSMIDDYKNHCNKIEKINPKEQVIKKPISKVECAKSLGFNNLAVLIDDIDYSSIKIPFPISLFVEKI